MGPHSFECGNGDGILDGGRVSLSASMGPHSFECGNTKRVSFSEHAETASMGPHSFECGNCQRVRAARLSEGCFNGAALVRVRKFA